MRNPKYLADIVSVNSGVKASGILSRSHDAEYSTYRYMTINLYYRLNARMSKTKIGHEFNRGHSSIIHGLNMHDRYMNIDKIYRDVYIKCTNILGIGVNDDDDTDPAEVTKELYLKIAKLEAEVGKLEVVINGIKDLIK